MRTGDKFSFLSRFMRCILLLQVFCRPSLSYHDPTSENTIYHCWWLNATADNYFPIECKGISLRWIVSPPDEIEQGQHFNVSYRLYVDQLFYDSKFGFEGDPRSPAEIEEFCKTSPCPPEQAPDPNLFRQNCSVWHSNIHVCHPTDQCNKPTQICGPWVNNDSLQSTHTVAQYGTINQTFTTEVWINYLYQNDLIAHIKVGEVQLALLKSINVVEPAVCGDHICDEEEDCETCPFDCCENELPEYAIVLIVVLFVAVVAMAMGGVVAGVCYQRHKFFYDESWIIDYNKIQRDIGYPDLMRVGSLVSLKNTRFFNEEKANGTAGAGVSDVQKIQLFTQTGIYEGRTVAIKRIPSPRKEFEVTKAIRKEVSQIRKLDHPNLCKFIGATVRSPGNLAIISEYCPKGSLNDVLQNEDIPLNWGFRFSFATDIARAMAYLHQRKIYHGRLRSSNCVIDDRWVVKISDYGLPSFRGQNVADDMEEGDLRRAVMQIYFPPEAKGKGYPLPTGPLDVYSFSIILLEIATRMDPYSGELFTDAKNRPKLPDLSQQECPCPSDYQELIDRCWSFSPASRPTFDQIKKILYRINPNHQSPVDMMMIMMEKYSKHLELLVAERTQELIAEQKKTANLLYAMLPQQVADDLRQGRPAAAQNFQSTTIFFSDIVGFTSLASCSTPMEVVTFLNELYSAFDDILDQFDVYKVETIGDAYMVVSGVPRENGDNHASEIAKMALQLMLTSLQFKIPHRPTETLKIRAGIHSGPVCAGVVGLKMPRYCLFGDTVNTASRMETTSDVMRIQCSDATYQLLRKKGEFNLECRGGVNVKGKGNMMTWWLTGLNERDDSLDGIVQLSASPSLPARHSNKKTMSPSMPNKRLTLWSKLPDGLMTSKGSQHNDLIVEMNKHYQLPGTPDRLTESQC